MSKEHKTDNDELHSEEEVERRGGECRPLPETEGSWRMYLGGTFSSDRNCQEKPRGAGQEGGMRGGAGRRNGQDNGSQEGMNV